MILEMAGEVRVICIALNDFPILSSFKSSLVRSLRLYLTVKIRCDHQNLTGIEWDCSFVVVLSTDEAAVSFHALPVFLVSSISHQELFSTANSSMYAPFPFQVIIRADPHIGLLHRGTEKLMEYKTFNQVSVSVYHFLNNDLVGAYNAQELILRPV